MSESIIEERDFPPLPRESAEARYRTDPVFRNLVDVMFSMLDRDGSRAFTPSELREATMLACAMYETMRIKPILILRGSK